MVPENRCPGQVGVERSVMKRLYLAADWHDYVSHSI